jgi:hypothetical protein
MESRLMDRRSKSIPCGNMDCENCDNPERCSCGCHIYDDDPDEER